MNVNHRNHMLRMLCAVFAALDPVQQATAAVFTLPIAKSLNDDLSRALSQGKPLLVMVSLAGCPFCKTVRENFLPSVELEQQLTVVQLDMRKTTLVKDFSGQITTHDQIIKTWDVKVAPTLLFFGRQGAEVAERLVGVSVPDFYGAYLQERIDKAKLAVIPKNN
jgi:thioredoxin-related protein